MRIGVDAVCWINQRGFGRFTRELLAAMVDLAPEDELICFLDPAAAAQFTLAGGRVRPVVVPQRRSPTQAASADGYRSPGDLLRFTLAVRRERPDVLFFPSAYTFFPSPPGVPAVVCFHDLIATRFPALTLPTARARLFWEAKFRLALWQSRVLLTVSEYAAADLVRIRGVSRSRIRVTGEAPSAAYRPSDSPADIAAAAAHAGLPAAARWFTYVGGFNPHKRLDVLVKAHARLAQELADPPHLVLVGTLTGDVFHHEYDAIRRAITEAGTDALVHRPGFVPDEELRHLHSGALGLVLASECEGFGLPAVEAAACGTPVVATLESPLPALLDGGGFFVAPGDVEGLARAMRVLATDPDARRTMGARARQRAGALTWLAAAQVTLAALREAAA